jgi:hypothetical protein
VACSFELLSRRLDGFFSFIFIGTFRSTLQGCHRNRRHLSLFSNFSFILGAASKER